LDDTHEPHDDQDNSRDRGRRGFYIAGVSALVLDQGSKLIIRALVPEGSVVTVIPRVFDIAPQTNTGAAFGMLAGSGPLLAIVGLVAVFAIVKLRPKRSRSRLLAVSLGLLLGGAIGNLVDRLTRGAVFDFLDFHVWPVFNLADAAVTIGGALLVIYWIVTPRNT
jgi:signal peptidase II